MIPLKNGEETGVIWGEPVFPPVSHYFNPSKNQKSISLKLAVTVNLDSSKKLSGVTDKNSGSVGPLTNCSTPGPRSMWEPHLSLHRRLSGDLLSSLLLWALPTGPRLRCHLDASSVLGSR